MAAVAAPGFFAAHVVNASMAAATLAWSDVSAALALFLAFRFLLELI